MIRAVFQLEGVPVDQLNLSPAVNAGLRDAAAKDFDPPWVFLDTPAYTDGYQLAGRYRIDTGTDQVTVSTYLVRNNQVVASDTVTGSSSQLESLVDQIIDVAEGML